MAALGNISAGGVAALATATWLTAVAAPVFAADATPTTAPTAAPAVAAPAAAAPATPPTKASPLDLNDDEINWRLGFITERLEGSKLHAQIWNGAWTVIQLGSLGYMTYKAASDDDEDDRGRAITEASKSFIGLMDLYLFRPMKARYGASEIAHMPQASRLQKLSKLKKGEEILERNAARADDRYGWQVHLGNVLLNFAGAGAIWATGGGNGDALGSAFAGIAGGELMMWTEPGQPRQDLRDYKNLTGGATFSEAPRSWHLVAIPGGIAVARSF